MSKAGLTDGWLNFLPPVPPSALWQRPRPLPFPFTEERCRTYDYGRHALWHGLRALGLSAGDELLVPAYNCGTEVAAIVALGIVPRFWGGGPELEPAEDEVAGLLGPRTRGLYLIHQLGIGHDAPRWRRWCDERDLLLLEDAAQGWPARFDGRPLGSWGDLALFSPWKSFGLPDCGAVLCDPPAASVPPRGGPPGADLAKAFLRWPLQRVGKLAELKGRRYEYVLDQSAEPAIGDPDRGAHRSSLALLRRLAGPRASELRARNYEWLRARLGERMPKPLRRPAGEGCPFGFPVGSADKPGLLRHLAARGISGLDFWALPHPAAEDGAFPTVEHLRRSVVVLPVHQELRQGDLDRLAAASLEWAEVPS
jgi:perosamine synthetase